MEWCWDLGLRFGTNGGASRRIGDAAREEARLEATRALARSSPVVKGVILRGYAWLNWAGIVRNDWEEEIDMASECEVAGRGASLIWMGLVVAFEERDGDAPGRLLASFSILSMAPGDGLTVFETCRRVAGGGLAGGLRGFKSSDADANESSEEE